MPEPDPYIVLIVELQERIEVLERLVTRLEWRVQLLVPEED